eukprot:CAMPEP_0195513032 /NCGR_PEP_ID=MMETSP0794_2-20130614/4791_1 /TAXON_ID=515487 /ORGANISM="Stephanopyxis turris, Strain CCMP 815" /LENGTH=515 /DNA_ID=CAMNT_0040640949 /DNA_START=46 /DNA_END=1593 /DNA_ORIENTATION=-
MAIQSTMLSMTKRRLLLSTSSCTNNLISSSNCCSSNIISPQRKMDAVAVPFLLSSLSSRFSTMSIRHYHVSTGVLQHVKKYSNYQDSSFVKCSKAAAVSSIPNVFQNFKRISSSASPSSSPEVEREEDKKTNNNEEEEEEEGKTESKRSQKWNNKLRLLTLYKLQNGHVNVPLSHPELGIWVSTQRSQYKRYIQDDNHSYSSFNMKPERIAALEKLGFAWTVKGYNRQLPWEERYEHLKEYKRKYGHTNVPRTDELGRWVLTQRKYVRYIKQHEQQLQQENNDGSSTPTTTLTSKEVAYMKNYMTQERIEALNEIGFEWTLRKSRRHDTTPWVTRFEQLQEYNEKHGNCNVPQNYPPNPDLGRWVKYQRQLYKRYQKQQEENEQSATSSNNNAITTTITCSMTPQHVASLNKIGFEWQRRKRRKGTKFTPWNDRYQLLKDFYDKNGHTDVPYTRAGFGDWVQKQRDYFAKMKEGDLTSFISDVELDRRIGLLEEIHFDDFGWWREKKKKEEGKTL